MENFFIFLTIKSLYYILIIFNDDLAGAHKFDSGSRAKDPFFFRLPTIQICYKRNRNIGGLTVFELCRSFYGIINNLTKVLIKEFS